LRIFSWEESKYEKQDEFTLHATEQTRGHEVFVNFSYKWINKIKAKQDRQCTYNVTLTRVRATVVAVEKQ
jgi:hypothetical protein